MSAFVGAQLVAQIIAAAAAAGVRTSMTLLAVGGVARLGWLDMPEGFAWASTDLGLACLLALVIFEEVMESNEDLQAITEHINYALRGIGGGLVAYELDRGVAGLTLPPAVAVAIGVAASVGTHHLRMRLHAALRGAGDELTSPRRWLVWLETGGMVGLLAAIFVAPFLALAFVLFAAMASGIALLTRRAAEDRLWRRTCPHCGHRARKEASRCPGCRAELPVERWLVRDAPAHERQ